jgi:hypothetical protein
MKAAAVFLAAVMGVAPLAAAIDFRPQEEAIPDADGDQTDYFFLHEGKRIYYQPPNRWIVAASSSRFSATSHSHPGASVLIHHVPPAPGIKDFSEPASLETLKRMAVAALPAGAVIVSTKAEPGTLGGSEFPCVRVHCTFDQHGERYQGVVVYARFRENSWVLCAPSPRRRMWIPHLPPH